MQLMYRAKQITLLIGDIICLSLGFWIALTVRMLTIPSTAVLGHHIPLFAVTFTFWIIINYINGLYDLSAPAETGWYRRILETGIFSLIVGIIFFYLLPEQTIAPKTILVLTVFFGYGMSTIWRTVYTKILGNERLMTPVLSIGYTTELQEIIEVCEKHKEKGYRIVAIIDPEIPTHISVPPSIAIYKNMEVMEKLIKRHDIRLVVTAPHLRQDLMTLSSLYKLLFTSIPVTDLTTFYQTLTGRIPPGTFSEGWFLDHLGKQDHPVYTRCKSGFDYVAAIFIGSIFLVTFPFIALLIKLSSPGPIFFRQQRVGKDGSIFTMYKYRSMYVLSKDGSAEIAGAQFASKNDQRVTPIGRILRLTRLDELPQVLNLLKRDISVIGPRPERPEIVEKLTKEMVYYPLRHIIKPGLTGWAMLHQDYTDTLEKTLQKLQYDLYYIKHHSLLLDFSILLKTINKIVRMKGQ